jgi:hypothetical protein
MTRATEGTETREPRVALVAVYENPSAAERAIEDLKSLGLRDDQLGILQRYRDTSGKLVEEADAKPGSHNGKDTIREQLPGGLDDTLLDVALVVVPQMGPVILAGALATDSGAVQNALSRATQSGASGGLRALLAGINLPDQSVGEIEAGLKAGGIILAAFIYEKVEHVRSVLERYMVRRDDDEPQMDEDVPGDDPLTREAREDLAESERQVPEDNPLLEQLAEHTDTSPQLSGGDVDADWERDDVGEETVGGTTPTPDQDRVDELGQALGITYEDNEPLGVDDKMNKRDKQRWELDPRSADKAA